MPEPRRNNAREFLTTVDLVDIVSNKYGVTLRPRVGELVGLCPFHSDKNPSFSIKHKVRPQIWACPVCNKGGSAADFIMEAEGWDFAAAMKHLEEGVTAGTIVPAKPREAASGEEWAPLLPVPPSAGPADFTHYRHGQPAKVWPYKNAAGLLLGYICRFDFPDGKKDLFPLTYCTNGTKAGWRWKGFPKPRPLYGLPELAARPTALVLLVEGEKTADAARRLVPAAVAVAWQGGTNQIALADWSALAGRNVILWPDADTPGLAAMYGQLDRFGDLREGAAHLLAAVGARTRCILPPPTTPEGWDLADGEAEGWDSARVRAFIEAYTAPTPEPRPYLAPAPAKPVAAPVAPPAAPAAVVAPAPPAPDRTPRYLDPDKPYRVLGYAKGINAQNEYFIYSYKARQALRFSSGQFTKAALVQIADVQFWEAEYGNFGKTKEWQLPAAQFLMNECYAARVYRPDLVRGTGAWIDAGRIVVHTGERIVHNSNELDLSMFNSDFIYEADEDFGFRSANPMPATEAQRLFELTRLMSWEKPAYSYLFLGWCVIAPVSGALAWRPHLWLTGAAGSGKTTAMEVLEKLLGPIALKVQGVTSEAGIRQTLGTNARPVIFDEADIDSNADAVRLQAILALVRSASSHDGGKIIKGGQAGTSQAFQVRSCFAFASITPRVANAADRSRVSVLSLTKRGTPENWRKMQELMTELLTPERCEALIARTLHNLPALLHNARIFARAAASVLGEQRAGDQLGALLAGAFSLQHEGKVDFAVAEKWVAERADAGDWQEIRNDEKDEELLLARILEQTVTVESPGGNKFERTVGELVEIAHSGTNFDVTITQGIDITIYRKQADERLRRLGLKVEEDKLYVSNTSAWLARVLIGTAWSANHSRVLGRLPGAEHTASNTYFAPGSKTRAVVLPLSVLKS